MRIKDWVRLWEEKVPLDLQDPWDKSGKQLGRFHEELKGIVFMLDLSLEGIERASDLGANLIVSHHPLLFSPVQELLDQTYQGEMIFKLIEEGICVYSSHTPFDRVKGGVNDYIFEKLDFEIQGTLEEDERYHPLSNGLGVWTEIQPLPLRDLATFMKKKLDLPFVEFFGDDDKMIKRVGLVAGSGASYYVHALQKNCDLLITGDIKYHTGQEALQEGICMMDICHDFLEEKALERMEEWSEIFAQGYSRGIYYNNRFYRKFV